MCMMYGSGCFYACWAFAQVQLVTTSRISQLSIKVGFTTMAGPARISDSQCRSSDLILVHLPYTSTMPHSCLIKIKLPSRVGPKVTAFGTILLKDDLGNKMANIRKRVREDPEEMAMKVLREWLAWKGVEVSWESLIATLRDCELSIFADQLTTALVQLS